MCIDLVNMIGVRLVLPVLKKYHLLCSTHRRTSTYSIRILCSCVFAHVRCLLFVSHRRVKHVWWVSQGSKSELVPLDLRNSIGMASSPKKIPTLGYMLRTVRNLLSMLDYVINMWCCSRRVEMLRGVSK